MSNSLLTVKFILWINHQYRFVYVWWSAMVPVVLIDDVVDEVEHVFFGNALTAAFHIDDDEDDSENH